jgi:NAD(P)-dependent dehydrogenase (short-subunit alcohol dehydrogenase family)
MGAKVRLQGATALVTGGGAGIGRETALALAARGTTVVVADLDLEAAGMVAGLVEEVGGAARAHQLDVADADAVAALAAVEDNVDVVVANAGVGMTGVLQDMALDDWAWIRGVNLDGVVHTARAFGAPMLARGRGHLVVMSSGLGYTPRATEVAYCTTKAAVLQFAQCLRADWGRHGVGVSAICPGVINTGILDRTRFVGVGLDEQTRARALFRRGHSPASVARDVVTAIERDRAMVGTGWEAKLGWFAHRALPLRAHQFVARQGLPR